MGGTLTNLLYTASTQQTQFTFPSATPSDPFCPLYYNL